MICKVRQRDDPIFSKPCLYLATSYGITPRVNRLIENMWDTLKSNNFAGLAANQIGTRKQIIVVNWENHAYTMINPTIQNFSTLQTVAGERCGSLSLEHTYYFPRPVTINVLWRDINFKPNKEIFSGSIARIIQHEIDHLNGIFINQRYEQWRNKR